MRMTDEGLRPFTDVFLLRNGQSHYSRYHGTLYTHEIERECKLLQQRLKKEGK